MIAERPLPYLSLKNKSRTQHKQRVSKVGQCNKYITNERRHIADDKNQFFYQNGWQSPFSSRSK